MRHAPQPNLAELLGAGLLAGFAGTAAITLAQTLEMRLTHRPPSDLPAKGAESVLHVSGRTPEERPRLNQMTHWGYGVAVGLYRAAAASLGLRGVAAAGAHLGMLYAGNSLLFARTGITDPPWRWSAATLAQDVALHAVYAAAAGAAFEALTSRR